MKIVIVGGGTAGWISAAMFVKYTNIKDVTLIESSKIPIIGAGEGSTGTLPWLIRDTWPDNSINEIDFLRKTKGTIKLGINLKNWKGDGKQIYSPFHGTTTDTQILDTALYGSILKYGRSDMASMHSWMHNDNLTTFVKHGGRIVPNFKYSHHDMNHSYHFDGHEVGKFFREWCVKRGVKLIDSEVVDTEFDSIENLKSITLTDGSKVTGDLFLDCTGFSKVLMSKTSNKWISYKDELICNSAIPFSTDISSRTAKFMTDAEALNSGWMWKIPLQHRHGCGYVYCDAFQTYEKSVEELEKKLGHKVDPIKHIKFEPGRYENVWHKNILAVGLSSHFLEPLQATSIHISITSVANFIFHHFKGTTLSELDRTAYNSTLALMIDDYKDFIQMHYITGRQDTPFWKAITNEMKISDRNKNLIDIAKYRTIGLNDIQQTHGSAGYPLWCHILDNAGLYKKDIILKELEYYNRYGDAIGEINNLKKEYEKLKPMLVPSDELFKYLKL